MAVGGQRVDADGPKPNDLYRAVLVGDWSSARCLLALDQSLAKYSNKFQRRTPLHAAFYLHGAEPVPRDVARALVRAHPGACKEADYDGLTPLHHFCNVSANEVDEILEEYTRGGEGASEDLIEMLLHEWPVAASTKDLMGRTPLHCAAERGLPSGVVGRLLRIDPGAVREQDASGRTPLDVAVKRLAAIEAIGEREGREAADALVLFLRAACCGAVSEDDVRNRRVASWYGPLHAALLYYRGFPPSVFSLLCSVFPEAGRIPDEGGNLPLHAAILLNRMGLNYGCIPLSNYGEAVQILLRNLPNACSVPNSMGRTPLNLALVDRNDAFPATARCWATARAIYCASLERARFLTTRDVETHMPPFLNAATASNRSYSSKSFVEGMEGNVGNGVMLVGRGNSKYLSGREEKTVGSTHRASADLCAQLNMVFELLMNDPAMVRPYTSHD